MKKKMLNQPIKIRKVNLMAIFFCVMRVDVNENYVWCESINFVKLIDALEIKSH